MQQNCIFDSYHDQKYFFFHKKQISPFGWFFVLRLQFIVWHLGSSNTFYKNETSFYGWQPGIVFTAFTTWCHYRDVIIQDRFPKTSGGQMDGNWIYHFLLHHDPPDQFLKQAHAVDLLIFLWRVWVFKWRIQ